MWAIDQKGGGKNLAETRLYVFPDEESRVLHLITIGDKSSQKDDIKRCAKFVAALIGSKKRGYGGNESDETGSTAGGKEGRYRNVSDMVRQLVDDQEFADDLEKQLALREIVKDLMALRAAANLSQQDIAARLKCSQSRVSKLEKSNDGNLRLGDLAEYADALGFRIRILLTPKSWTAADEVKYHAFRIKGHLDHLAALA